MTLRAMGPFNGTLPIPTQMVIGFLRNPDKFPWQRYVETRPAPEIIFDYTSLDPDEPVRVTDLNENVWAYDDERPNGAQFTLRSEAVAARVTRYDFPYQIGESTMRVWRHRGLDVKGLFDKVRASQCATHRAQRILTAMTGATWTSRTSSLNTLLSTSGAYFDKSSGAQYDPATGLDNPNFQIIKRAFQRVRRIINLSTNGAVMGDEMVAVISPVVAEAIAQSGEMVEFLKQSSYAKELTNPNNANWSLPESYAGFKLVVEDSPRCFINQKADGTVADVTVPAQKDYILNTDTIYFVSRPGGLEGGYGHVSFSTMQLWTFNGLARVDAFSDPEHELTRGHIVVEDKPIAAAILSGYRLTDVLS